MLVAAAAAAVLVGKAAVAENWMMEKWVTEILVLQAAAKVVQLAGSRCLTLGKSAAVPKQCFIPACLLDLFLRRQLIFSRQSWWWSRLDSQTRCFGKVADKVLRAFGSVSCHVPRPVPSHVLEDLADSGRICRLASVANPVASCGHSGGEDSAGRVRVQYLFQMLRVMERSDAWQGTS